MWNLHCRHKWKAKIGLKRVKEDDFISPINTLPVIKDLIVKRDAIPRQMIGYNKISNKNNLNVEGGFL